MLHPLPYRGMSLIRTFSRKIIPRSYCNSNGALMCGACTLVVKIFRGDFSIDSAT